MASAQKIASRAPAAPRPVTGRAFRRGDRRPFRGLFAKRELDHPALARVPERGRGAVRVDVLDLVRAIPASANAIRIARAGPSPVGSGSVMCSASEETP